MANSAPESGLPPGFVIAAKFEILQKLRSSEFGTSYQARNKENGNLVNLKFFNRSLLATDSDNARKQADVKTCQSISHPNLVHPIELSEDDRFGKYLMREYITGRSLAQIIKEKGALNQIEFFDMIQQAGKGLVFAHKKKFAHGDLKPNNIIITDDFVVRIVDYCSGDSSDLAEDIYALGWTMYEALGGTPRPEKNAIPDDGPRPFIALIPARKVEPQLETVIFRCLAKEKTARYQSMEALLADLKRVEEGDEAKPLSKGGSSPSGKIIPFAAVAVIFVIGIAGAFIFAKQGHQETSPEDRARAEEQMLAAEESKADALYADGKYMESAEVLNKIEPVITEKHGAESVEHIRVLQKLARAEVWNRETGQGKSTYTLLAEILNRRPDLAPKDYQAENEVYTTAKKMYAKKEYALAGDTFAVAFRIAKNYTKRHRATCDHILVWEGRCESQCGDFKEATKSFNRAIESMTGTMSNLPDLSLALKEYGAMLIRKAETEDAAQKKATLRTAEDKLKQALELYQSRNDAQSVAEINALLKSIH